MLHINLIRLIKGVKKARCVAFIHSDSRKWRQKSDQKDNQTPNWSEEYVFLLFCCFLSLTTLILCKLEHFLLCVIVHPFYCEQSRFHNINWLWSWREGLAPAQSGHILWRPASNSSAWFPIVRQEPEHWDPPNQGYKKNQIHQTLKAKRNAECAVILLCFQRE